VRPEEFDTIEKLLRFGIDIVCKKELNVPYQQTADIIWKKEIWEIKCLFGNSRHTIRNNLRKAKKQSKNIVIDISNSRIKIGGAISHISDFMRRNKDIKKILIVNKNTYCIIDRSALK
jgi:hypothetical protein